MPCWFPRTVRPQVWKTFGVCGTCPIRGCPILAQSLGGASTWANRGPIVEECGRLVLLAVEAFDVEQTLCHYFVLLANLVDS